MKDLKVGKFVCVLVIVAAIISLITCSNDNVITGLGSQVDTSQPVVSIITEFGTGPGTYLTGQKRIYIDATDDMGVDTVTVVYSYYYLRDGVQYPMEAVVDAVWSETDGCYVLDIDTLNGFYDEPTKSWLPMVDGPLTAVVIVSDKSGKRTVTPEIIYTVKNGPPKISMQIPKPRTRNSELLNEDPYPIVIQDSYFMGVFEDLAGLAPGYPLIKFWETGKPEPENYRENAGWENVTSYNSPGDGWVRPDEGVSESARGEKGGSFRYFLRKRQPNGKAFAEETKNGLTPKKTYNLKIKAVDINGIELEWPHDVYPNVPKAKYMTVFMEAEGIPPAVEILSPDPLKQYFRENFQIIARAENQGDLSTEIAELRFEVIGKDRQTVLLKKWLYPEIKSQSEGKFLIELEKTYFNLKEGEDAKITDNLSEVPADAPQVTFTDGNFNFSIIAYDDVGARKTVPLSIYVDKQAPVTNVTSITPYYTQDPTGTADGSNGLENKNKPYRRWTVNKTVKIAVSSTDNRGDAFELNPPYAKFKYLFSFDSDISPTTYTQWKGSDTSKTFEQFLYEGSGAKFFDAVRADSNPTNSSEGDSNFVEFVEGKDGSYTLWLQTHKYNTKNQYNLWMYIVAMDNAGNISFDKILIYVDQDTDKPKIAPDFSTFMNDKSLINLTFEDDNGLSNVGRNEIPNVKYRFAKNKEDMDYLIARPEERWHQVYDWQNESWENILSQDVKRITINDLSLKKIADNLGLKQGEDLKTVLGAESDKKYIQIRAIDNVTTKVYPTDGTAASITGWLPFTMDLTIPEIKISEKDLYGVNNISRDKDNPFGIPEKNRAYNNMTHIYGDIIEENLKSISVKIDGKNDQVITYTILDNAEAGMDETKFSVIHPSRPLSIDSKNFYVWKNNADNSKRWHIPRDDFKDLSDGPHTFEISFEDKVPQNLTTSFTFYKDTKGPVVSFVNPGGTDTLTDTERTTLNSNLVAGASLNYPTTSGLTADTIYKRLIGKSIKDMSTKLSGTFTDDYSPIADAEGKYSFKWRIDDGVWQTESLTTEDTDSKSINWEVPLTRTIGGVELDNGVHILSISVKDSLGNGSDTDSAFGGLKKDIAFLIDKSVPKLEVTDYPKKAINGNYTFKGKITETISVKQLTVKLGNDEIATIDVEKNDDKYPLVNGNKYGLGITVIPTPSTGMTFDFTVTINPAVGGLEDGPKSLMFSAVGSSGQSGMTTSSFTLDTKGPSIAIGAPISGDVYVTNTEWGILEDAVIKDDFSSASSVDSIYDKVFTARIKDGSPSFALTFADEASFVFETGKDKFWYKFDNDPSWLPVTVGPSDLNKTSVSLSLPLPADKRKDGVHRISVRATDSLGNGFNESTGNSAAEKGSGVGYQSNLVFMIDTGVPELVVKDNNGNKVPSEAQDFGIHNKSFNISGEITGTYDVQDLSIKIGSLLVAQKPNSGATTNMLFTKKPNSKRTYYFENVSIDPLSGTSVTDGSKDGSYTVSVSVKGSSEQSVSNVSTFILDTQGPKITVNAPIKEKIYLSDPQRSTIETAISTNNIESLKSETITSGNTTTTLEKVYYDLLRYNVKDAASKLSGSFADTYSDVGTQYLYKFNNGTWESGDTIITNNGNLKSKDWEIDLSKKSDGTPRTLNDGMNSLSIRVKDTLSNGFDTGTAPLSDNSGGNGYESNINFILDTISPVLTKVGGLKDTSEGEEPTVKGPPGYFTVTGQVTGTFMVKRLSVSIGGSSESELGGLGQSATVLQTIDGVTTPLGGNFFIDNFTLTPAGKKTFNYSFNVITKKSGGELAYGSRTITINAVGSSDNSDVKTLSFIYDNKGPTVNVSVPSSKIYLDKDEKGSLNNVLDNGLAYLPGQEDIYKKLDAMVISDASAKLSGTFNDDYSDVAVSGSNTFWWDIDNSGTWKEGTLGVNNKSVSWEVDIANLDVGVHILSLRVKDSLGNGYDKYSGLTGSGGGNGFETDIAFLIDKNPPEIKDIVPPPAAINGQFSVTGTVINTYGVKKLSVKLGNDEIAYAEKNSLGNYVLTPKPGFNYVESIVIDRTGGIGKSFDFTVTINPVAGSLEDGPKSLTFTAIGSSNQAAIGVNSFTYDTTGPKVTIGAPINDSSYIVDTEWTALEYAVREDKFAGISTVTGSPYDKLFQARIKDNTASFTVTFADTYSYVFESGKNTSFWYRFDDGTWEEGVAPITEFNKNSASVKVQLPDGGTWTDGLHRLSVRVKDSLKNGYDNNTLDGVISALTGDKKNNDYGHETYRTFMIDSGKPTIAFTGDKTELGVFSKTESPSISGTITGTYKVQELNAKIGSSTKNIDLKSFITDISGSMKTYNFNVPIDSNDIFEATKYAEGSYTISLTAKGSSDQSDMKVSTFILDTQGPAISINAPINKVYLGPGQISAIEDAMSKNKTESLGTDDKRIFFKLLNNNVKDVSAGLSGSFSDTYSEIGTKYWYSFNGGAWKEEETNVSSADNKNTVGWNINLTTQLDGTVTIPNGETLKDGLNSLSIRVRDSLSNGYDNDSPVVPDEGGYGYETNVNFILDTGAPVLSAVTGDLSDGNVPTVLGPMTSSDYVRVNGVITGTYMVKRLSVSLGNGATIALTNDGNITYQKGDTNIRDIHLEPVNASSKTFNYYFDVNTSGLAYGSRTITINALGSSDNSDVKTVSFIYDDKGPNVSVSVPSKKLTTMSSTDKDDLNTALINGTLLTTTQLENYNILKTMLITDTSTKLSGTFNDEYSAVTSNTNKTFWWKIDGYQDWTEKTLPVSAEKSVAWEVPINELGDGVYLLSLRAKDEWGNGSGAAPGTSGYENNIAFMIDRNKPEIENLSVPQEARKTQFNVSGTIENTYGIKRLSIKLGNDEIAVIEDALTAEEKITYPSIIPYGSNLIVSRGTGKTFNFTAEIDPSLGNLKDGPISLTFTAIGSSGQVAIGVSNFILDKTGPAITVGAPINDSVYLTNSDLASLNSAVNTGDFSVVSADTILNSEYERIYKTRVKDSSASFTITFTDDKSNIFAKDRNETFWYSFDGKSFVTQPVDSADYGKKSVSVKLPIPKEIQKDGVHSLSIRVMDSLGNGVNSGPFISEPGSEEGYINNLIFMIDSGKPELSFGINGAATINDQGSLTLSGEISNTFEVQELSVKIGSTVVASKAGEGGTYISVNDAVNKKEFSFDNVNINKNSIKDATEGKEGSYTISVTVKGSSDQSEMKVSTFVLDTKGPAISINAPIKEKIYLDSGEITEINNAISSNNIDSLESSGLKTVYYKLLNYNVKEASAGLSGSFDDTYSNIANEYWYSFDGVNWEKGTPVSGSNKKSADWQIPLTERSDGLNQVSIRVKDSLGNGSDGNNLSNSGCETNITFILDTAVPILTTGGFVNNTVYGPKEDRFKISGQISGTYLVKRLSVSLVGPNATIIETSIDSGVQNIKESDTNIKNIELTPGSTGKTFNYTFDVINSINQAGVDVPLLENGSHSITVNAIGSSDQSVLQVLSFIFDKKGPDITVNTPITKKIYINDTDLATIKSGVPLTGVLETNYNKLVDMGIKDASAGLNGYFNDEFSKIAGEDHKTFWYKFLDDDPATGWEPVEITNITDKSVAWNIPLTDPKDPVIGGSPNYRKDGLYRVSIRVKDSLGNGYGINPQDDTAINNLNALDNNRNMGPGHETELAFIIDMGIPKFTKFKLEKNGVEADTNIFYNGDFKIIGTIENTVSITKLSAKISGKEVAIAGASVTSPTPGVKITKVEDKKFTFEIPVSPSDHNLDEKAHSVSVTVTGSSGQSAIETCNFTYDITPPTANFNSPSSGERQVNGILSNGVYSIWWSKSWETGLIKIGGVADDTFGIDKIYYHIGKMIGNIADGDNNTEREATYNGADWKDTNLDITKPTDKWSGGLYYWNYADDLNPLQFSSIIEKDIGEKVDDPTPSMFYLPFYVKIVDRAGNINVVHYKVYVDPDKDKPSTKIVSPSDGVRVGGEIRVTGTANDNNWVHSVDIRIYDTVGKSYYKNDEDAWVTNAADGWVKAKIVGSTDVVVSWYYTINADGKLTPEPGMQDRPVKIEVRAWDTKDMLKHEIPDLVSQPSTVNYIFDSGIPTISVPVISKAGIDNRSYTDGIRVSGEFKVSAVVKDDGGISSIRARLTGSSQFKEIVKDGAIDTAALATEPNWKVYANAPVPSSAPWISGWRYYIVNPGTAMNWDEIDLDWYSGKTYPTGTTIKYNGVTVKGTGATAMKAEGTQVVITGNKTADLASPNWNTQFFTYTVEFTINSINNFPYGKSGIFTLELDVNDNNKQPAPYNTRGTYNMGVDNFYPSAVITTQYNASTGNFFVMGTASDYDNQSGSQQGLARMLVYFQRGNKYYNAHGIEDSATGESMISYPDVRDWEKGDLSTTYGHNGALAKFPLLKLINRGGEIGEVWESPHAMVIDRQEIGIGTDTDMDGTDAEMWEGNANKVWQARLDTTEFIDGPITVHYIIMDQAGNATHYAKEIYIGNHKPLIIDINLGTDINASGGDLSEDEYLEIPITIGDTLESTKVIQTGFRVRNDSFGLKLYAISGNGTKNYRISHVTRNENVIPATSMDRGTVYTIATPGNTDWTKFGAKFNNAGTTFVATGKADSGTGTVYEYTPTGGTAEGSGAFNVDNDNAKYTFTDFTNMPDTEPKTYDGNGKMDLLRDKFFIVKVYDSTVPGVNNEDQQLAHVALLNLDFDNKDEHKPTSVINPFQWTSAAINNLYKNSRDNGHIEIGGTPKVSGQISIRGTASDNNIIRSLWANMEGLALNGSSLTEVKGTPPNQITYYRIANFTPAGGLEGEGASNNDTFWKDNGWKCTILSEVNDQDGHRVEYQLDIDTNKHTNVAATNQSLRIFAKDYGNNDQIVSGTQTTTAAKTSLYTMDIVPYISNIVTKLTDAYAPNPPAFSRSAKGWYPVREDEVIAIEGFNLFKSGDPLVDIRQTSNAAVIGSALHTNGAGSHNVNKIYARIDNNNVDGNGNDISSGYLVVQVNGIDSINNTNENTEEYNKEANGLNNNTLNDDRALYVWTTGSMMPAGEAVSSIYNPVMRMTNAGVRVMSYGFYNAQSTGRLKVLRNNSAVNVGVSFSNRMYNTTIAVSNGNASWYAAGTDISSSADRNKGFQIGKSTADGTASTYAHGTSGDTNNDINNATGYHKIIELMGDSVSTRIKIPRIAVQSTGSGNRSDNNVDRLFMSYYDDEKKELKAMYGIVGETDVGNISPSAPETVASNNTTRRGSPYTAAGLMSNGRPVVAWYDAYYRKLYLSWGNGTPSTQTLSGGRTSWVNNNTGTYTTTGAALTANANILVGVGNLPTAGNTAVNATEARVTTGGTSFTLNASVGDVGNTVSFVTTSYTPSGAGTTGTGNNARRYFTFPANTFAQNDVVIISYNGVVEGNTRVVRNAGPDYQFAYSGTTTTPDRFMIPEGDTNSDYTKIKVYKVTGNNANVRTATVSGVTNGWQTNAIEIDSFRGTHVDMAIDEANNVHLAYYDVSNGGLWYALVKASNGTNTDSVPSGTITKVRVDTYLSAGTKIMLNVRQETRMINNVSTTVYVPYITYAHGSFSETENSVRVAWRTDFTDPDTPPEGSNDKDSLTGAWEVMTVPTNQVPKTDEFICNGVPTSAVTGPDGWQEPTAGGNVRLVKGNQDLAKSILVGYLTENWYEGAILKKDIW
jgi:hypothetical protein